MDRTQLFQHFDTLAETPDAVEKLRKLVLDFAIRGRLVPQNPKDDPATQLVERAKAVLAKNRKKPDDQNQGEPEGPPFSLPKNWCWTRLEELGNTSPRNELDDEIEVGFSPMRLVNAKFGEPISFERKTWSEIRKGFTHFANGDVVVAKITPCFQNGKSGVIRGAPNGFGAGTTELHVLRPVGNCVLPDYALVFVKSSHFLINGEAHMTGTAGQKRVSWDYFARTPFPLPPLAEQRRIVAKVEELLALCDELEVRQTAAREHRTRLVRSALDHLTAGVCPSPGAATSARTRASESSSALRPHHAAAPEDGRTPDHFPRHTAFVLNTFPDLAAAPEDVPALRQAILSLAVQGRLVSRDTKKPIQDLVMEDLVGQKNLKNGLSLRQTAGAAKYSCLPISAMRDGLIRCSDRKPVILTEERAKPYLIKANDVFIVRGNGSTHLVGRAGIVEGNPTDLIFPDLFIRVPLDGTRLDARYFVLAWNSPEMRRRIESIAKTTAGILKINQGHIAALSLPVPPLSEQQRIVAKVDELLRWCDALEARLTAAQTTAVHLLDATLHQILASA